MHKEECFVQIAIEHIRNMRGNDGTNLVSPTKESADTAKGA